MDVPQFLVFLPSWVAHSALCMCTCESRNGIGLHEPLLSSYSKYIHSLNATIYEMLSYMECRHNFKTGLRGSCSNQVATMRCFCTEPCPLHLPHLLWEHHDLSTMSGPTQLLMGDGLTPGTISLLLEILTKQSSTYLCISQVWFI